MQSAEREAQVLGNIGYNGTGKTTRTKAQLKALLANGGKGLIIEDQGLEEAWHEYPVVEIKKGTDFTRLTGINRVFLPISDNLKEENKLRFQFFQWIERYFRNGTLVLDDCKTYVDSFPLRPIQNMMRTRRQLMLDIIWNAHGFTEVPPMFYTFVEKIYLGYTMDNPDRSIKKLPHPEKMQKIKDWVDYNAASNPYYFYPIEIKKLPLMKN